MKHVGNISSPLRFDHPRHFVVAVCLHLGVRIPQHPLESLMATALCRGNDQNHSEAVQALTRQDS